jgi:hypothetical protein
MASLKIPFKVQPKKTLIEVGNETTGVLEIESLESLSIAEKMTIEKEGLLDIPKAVAKLARKIWENLNQSTVKDDKGFGKKISLVSVNDAIARRVNGDSKKEDSDLELIGDYLDELLEIQDRILKERERKIQVYAHAVATHRLKLDCTIEELDQALGSALMARVGLFALYEESGLKYKETPDEEAASEPKPVQETSEEDLLK